MSDVHSGEYSWLCPVGHPQRGHATLRGGLVSWAGSFHLRDSRGSTHRPPCSYLEKPHGELSLPGHLCLLGPAGSFSSSWGFSDVFPKGTSSLALVSHLSSLIPSPLLPSWESCHLLGGNFQPIVLNYHHVPSPLWVDSGTFRLDNLCTPIFLLVAPFLPIPLLLHSF